MNENSNVFPVQLVPTIETNRSNTNMYMVQILRVLFESTVSQSCAMYVYFMVIFPSKVVILVLPCILCVRVCVDQEACVCVSGTLCRGTTGLGTSVHQYLPEST